MCICCMQIYLILADNGKFGCGIYVLSGNSVQIEITELDVVVHVEDEAVFIRVIAEMAYFVACFECLQIVTVQAENQEFGGVVAICQIVSSGISNDDFVTTKYRIPEVADW